MPRARRSKSTGPGTGTDHYGNGIDAVGSRAPRKYWGRVYRLIGSDGEDVSFHSMSPDGWWCKHWNADPPASGYHKPVYRYHSWLDEEDLEGWADCTAEWIMEGRYPW